jgi:hypothetical protein
MSWLAICIPFMLVGVAVATLPLAYATHHQHRYGPNNSDPQRRKAPRQAALPPGTIGSSSVCPRCAALVVDRKMHDTSVHAVSVS